HENRRRTVAEVATACFVEIKIDRYAGVIYPYCRCTFVVCRPLVGDGAGLLYRVLVAVAARFAGVLAIGRRRCPPLGGLWYLSAGEHGVWPGNAGGRYLYRRGTVCGRHGRCRADAVRLRCCGGPGGRFLGVGRLSCKTALQKGRRTGYLICPSPYT